MTTETQTAAPIGTAALTDTAIILACKAKDAREFDAMRALARELRQVAAEIEAIADANEPAR